MQLSVWKHYIQFAYKKNLLKYIISKISTHLKICKSVFIFHKGGNWQE